MTLASNSAAAARNRLAAGERSLPPAGPGHQLHGRFGDLAIQPTSRASAYLAMAYCSRPVAFLASACRTLAISISLAPPAGTALQSLPSTCARPSSACGHQAQRCDPAHKSDPTQFSPDSNLTALCRARLVQPHIQAWLGSGAQEAAQGVLDQGTAAAGQAADGCSYLERVDAVVHSALEVVQQPVGAASEHHRGDLHTGRPCVSQHASVTSTRER